MRKQAIVDAGLNQARSRFFGKLVPVFIEILFVEDKISRLGCLFTAQADDAILCQFRLHSTVEYPPFIRWRFYR